MNAPRHAVRLHGVSIWRSGTKEVVARVTQTDNTRDDWAGVEANAHVNVRARKAAQDGHVQEHLDCGIGTALRVIVSWNGASTNDEECISEHFDLPDAVLVEDTVKS